MKSIPIIIFIVFSLFGANVQCQEKLRKKDYKLINAVNTGNFDAVKKLIKNGANINAVDANNSTPLILAVEYPHILEFLIEEKANLNAENNHGETALIRSIIEDQLESMVLLGESGAIIDPPHINPGSCLMLASLKNKTVYLKYLIGKMANVNAQSYFSESPLTYAIEFGTNESVRLLVANGANVNTLNGHGETPLILAARLNRHDVLEILINNKANVNAMNRNNQTALSYAITNRNRKSEELLLKHGGTQKATNRTSKLTIPDAQNRSNIDTNAGKDTLNFLHLVE